MFIENQSQEKINEYLEMLKIVASLSNMFSNNTKPYLDYRATENLFCMCLNAENLSRSDCTADASINNVGFGIKTFLDSGSKNSMQKVAEFNKLRNEYAELDKKSLINVISSYRNDRINVTKNIYNLSSLIYHNVIRDTGKIFIVEEPMDLIDLDKIKVTSTDLTKNVVNFNDDRNEYGFNISKSVLYKRFYVDKHIYEVDVEILENPYDLIKQLMKIKDNTKKTLPSKECEQHIYLPLYSTRGGGKNVPEKSGLNQWNANGRARNANEIYIQIPMEINKKYPNFFPPRDQPFKLNLPNGEKIVAKVCQEASKSEPKLGKALMSNPNNVLGKWLLRDVMNLKSNELLTMNKLESIGLDSVVIYKNFDDYTIDFAKIDSYENFIGGEIYNG